MKMILSLQQNARGTAVTDIAIIPYNVSLCRRAWVISEQGGITEIYYPTKSREIEYVTAILKY